MIRRRLLICAAVVITLAVSAALAFESVYDVTFMDRRSDPVTTESRGIVREPGQQPLPLRFVDTGGVGIPLSDSWGADYSHDRRVFREVILEAAPYVNASAFEQVDREWRAYVHRMLDYGNNAIVVPMLIELIDFDRLRQPSASPGALPIYAEESSYRARHAAVRRLFGPLFEWTEQQGMQVFLDTDMLTLTLPLSRYLRTRAPVSGDAGIDTSDAAVWEVYRAGLEELFDQVPSIKGVVIRFGEGGSLYSTKGWPYYSEVAIRNAASLRAMLRGLLPLFEARNKVLVLRSWTVGVGSLGRLHVDPDVYERVLGDIDSRALIVSTKFTAGDFFSYLPLNPTLARGRHRRIIELQAKPEFEGFGAFPNFLGDEHSRALRVLRSVNPHIVGTYVLAQFGGPLRAGPRMLYPFHGYWLWTDANVFVASGLAMNPDASVETLSRQWVTARFGTDPRIVDAMTSVLVRTREAVLKGFYIRPFAERAVAVPGLELPPLMWIFEWDMVGGWHSLLSIVYRGTHEHLDEAIQEGHEAARLIREARQRLAAAVQAAGPDACGNRCDETLLSLEYQETLFDALAAWRHAFLSYYRWLETGDEDAWREWRSGRDEFEVAAARHVERFGNNSDFPAFDLTSAYRAISTAERAGAVRTLAATMLLVVIALLVVGNRAAQRSNILGTQSWLARVSRLTWTTSMTPWRLDEEVVTPGPAIAVTTLTLFMVGGVVGTLTAFTTAWAAVNASALFAIVSLAFAATAADAGALHARVRVLLASTGPLVPGLAVLFALIAYLGPVGFWYAFWTLPALRIVFLSVLISMLLWTVCVMLGSRTVDGWRDRFAGVLIAAGAGTVVLAIVTPGWVEGLRLLDRPLNFAPATETMLFALQAYAGVSLEMGRSTWGVAAFLLMCGCAMRWQSTNRR